MVGVHAFCGCFRSTAPLNRAQSYDCAAANCCLMAQYIDCVDFSSSHSFATFGAIISCSSWRPPNLVAIAAVSS